MKQTKSGKIACTVHSCQCVATHRVQSLVARGIRKPYPRYYCEYHARAVMVTGTTTVQNVCGFTVVPTDGALSEIITLF